MDAKINQASEPGEYDDGLLTLLQLLWGDGFLSPGGAEEVARVLEGCSIDDCEVLDIGAALGRIDQLLVEVHGARRVVGIDVDPALLAAMHERIARAGLSSRIETVRVSPGPLPFEDNRFDVVFSKDSIVQIPDKDALYADIFRVLKPGGRFVASDWLFGGTRPYSAEMMEYFRLEGIAYNMATPTESKDALERAGFGSVALRDRHDWYLALAERELASLSGPLMPLVTEKLGPERARHFVINWEQLVLVLRRGELRPTHLRAVKPTR